MEYVVGVVLALAVGVGTAAIGFDRDRSFFPTVLIVIGSLYVLFATMAPSGEPLAPEMAAAAVFVGLAVLGFRRSPWFAVAGIAGHGVFDLLHGHVIENSGVPSFWPGFCMSFDVVFGAWAGYRIVARRREAGAGG